MLEYTVAEGHPIYPQPQQQALYALRWLRAQASDLNIAPQRIGEIVMGVHKLSCIIHSTSIFTQCYE